MVRTKSSEACHFFSLPRELRDLIYKELPTISAPTKITHKWNKGEELKASVSGLPCLPLLLLNKQFRHEYEMIANSSMTLVLEDHISNLTNFQINFKDSAVLTKVTSTLLKLRLGASDNHSDVDCHAMWVTTLLQDLPQLRNLILDLRIYDSAETDPIRIANCVDEYHDQLEKMKSLPFVSDIGIRTLSGWRNPTVCDYNQHWEHIATWCSKNGAWIKSK